MTALVFALVVAAIVAVMLFIVGLLYVAKDRRR